MWLVSTSAWIYYIDDNKSHTGKATWELHKNATGPLEQIQQQQLYRHLAPITQITQLRRSRHEGYCSRNKNELISDVLP